MRVLVLTPDFPPRAGGIQRLVHRLVTSWREVDTIVLTSALTRSVPMGSSRRWCVRAIGAPRALGRRGRVALLNAQALVVGNRFRPDAVMSAHCVTAPGAWGLNAITGTPYLQYVYGKEAVQRPHLTRFAVSHAAAVIAISRYTCSLVARWVDGKTLHRIAPGVDVPAQPIAHRRARPTIVTVGRLSDRYKGHDVLLGALPLVRARIPDVEWVVIGDGPLRPLYEGMAARLKLGDTVRFLGEVDDVDRDWWLDGAHVFAMPSRLSPDGAGEGFGIVYLEAGAHQLPVVAGDAAGARDAVIDGVTGLQVDPTSTPAVAEALIGLLLDPVRAQTLGRAGRARAQEFAWPRVAERVEALLLAVAARAI